MINQNSFDYLFGLGIIPVRTVSANNLSYFKVSIFMFFRIVIVLTVLSLSACSSWVFRYDIAQGNYLDQRSIDKLQVDMTKEQVKYILGSPVVVDAFDDDSWNYVYKLKSGRDEDFDRLRKLVINFVDNKVVSASGDYKLSENFNVPFNKHSVQESDLVGRSEIKEISEDGSMQSGSSEGDDLSKTESAEKIVTEEGIETAAEEAIEEAELEAEEF